MNNKFNIGDIIYYRGQKKTILAADLRDNGKYRTNYIMCSKEKVK